MARRDWPLITRPDITGTHRCPPSALAYYLGRGWVEAPEPPPPTRPSATTDVTGETDLPPSPRARRRRGTPSSEED